MTWSRRLRFSHLNWLISLGETCSLSETARHCYTTQPALSRWLKELEDDVGIALFERHARGLIPTAAGKLLITYAQRMHTDVERAEDSLTAIKEGSGRMVAIGTSPASAPSFVPTAISHFLKLQPNAKVQLYEDTMDILMQKLALGELDLVVGRMDNYKPHEDFQNEVLYEESICIVSRLSHPLAQKEHLIWQDLYQYDWIVWPSNAPIRSKLDASLAQAGLKPPAYRIESNSMVANLWLLQYTDAIAVASDRVARHFYGRGLLVPLKVKIPKADGAVGMVWRDTFQLDPYMADLLQAFRGTIDHDLRF